MRDVRAVPASDGSVQKEPQVGERCGIGHVTGIQGIFHEQNDVAEVLFQLFFRDLNQKELFLGKRHGCRARNPWTTLEQRSLLFRDFGPRSHETHFAAQHVEELRQLVEFPPP